VLVALRFAMMVVVGRSASFLSARVPVVPLKRIPAAVYDIEMNAPGIPLVARHVFGADAAESGTFCHRGTPRLQSKDPAVAGAEKTKTPQAGEALRRRISRNSGSGGGGGRLVGRPGSVADGPTGGGRLNPVPRLFKAMGRKFRASLESIPKQ
jgi:hypothetical protein